MNTKHRMLSVLLILAMVTTLCIVMAAPASAQVTSPTYAVSNTSELTAAPVHTITFVATTAIVAGNTITLSFDGAYAAPGSVAAGVVSVNGTDTGAVCVYTNNAAPTDDTLAIPVIAGMVAGGAGNAGATITVVIKAAAAYANPVFGTYSVDVATTTDPVAATTATYSILDSVSGVTWTPGPATAGTAASHTVAFTTSGAGAVAATTGTISITFPTGVTVPSTISKSYVSVGGTVCTVDPVVTGNTVGVVVPAAAGIANNTAGTVVISQLAGITNPSLSSAAIWMLQVSTHTDLVPANSAAANITDWITASPMAAAKGASITVTGGGFYPGSSIDITGGAAGTGTVGADGTISVTAYATGVAAVITATDGSSPAARTAATSAAVTVLPRVTLGFASTLVGSTGRADCYDFTAGGTITGITVGGVAATIVAGAAMTDRDGDGAADDAQVTFTIPVVTGGLKTVAVTDGTLTGTATLSVTAQSASVSPSSGPGGTTVVVTGSGLPANQTAAVNSVSWAAGTTQAAFLDSATNVLQTDGSGSFSFTGTIPSGALDGAASIACTVGGVTVRATFTVSSRSLSISPASGPQGTQITVSGSNMTSGGTIAAAGTLWNGVALTGAPGTTIDTAKNIVPFSAYVPTTAAIGINALTCVDSGTLTATGYFTVTTPTLVLSASESAVGSTVTFTGSGWVPGARGLVSINMPVGTLVTTAIPDAAGNISGSFVVPATIPGTGAGVKVTTNINATDTYTNAATTQTFIVPAPSIAVDPDSAAITTDVTITGSGFTPYTGVTAASIGGVPVLQAGQQIITNPTGEFTMTVTVPGVAVGGRAVSVTAGVTATTILTVTAAPAAPVAPTAVATGLASIADSLVPDYVVWTFDNATKDYNYFDSAAGATSTLEGLTAGTPYWVEVSEDCTLTFGSNTYMLYTGWNYIAWLG